MSLRQSRNSDVLWHTCERWPKCRTSATTLVTNLVERVLSENDTLRDDLDKAQRTVSRLVIQLEESIRTGSIVATQLEESRKTLAMFAGKEIQ